VEERPDEYATVPGVARAAQPRSTVLSDNRRTQRICNAVCEDHLFESTDKQLTARLVWLCYSPLFFFCADHHEHVYVSSFRRLLKQSQLDPALLANDVRIVLENAYTEAKAQAQQLTMQQ